MLQPCHLSGGAAWVLSAGPGALRGPAGVGTVEFKFVAYGGSGSWAAWNHRQGPRKSESGECSHTFLCNQAGRSELRVANGAKGLKIGLK